MELTLGDRAVSGASRQPQGDPVRRYAPDSEYAAAEYGVTLPEIAAAGKRMRRASDAARRSGEIRAVSGIDSLRE